MLLWAGHSLFYRPSEAPPMLVSVSLRKARIAAGFVAFAVPFTLGCSPEPAAESGTPPTGQSGSTATTGGSSPGGATGTGASAGMPTEGGGATGVGGDTTAGGTSVGGSGGGDTAGSGGSVSGGTGGNGFEEGDTPPWRALNVYAAPDEHQHGNAGVDNRAPTMLGKLIVDIGVNSGGYISWLAKRGYHSIGAPCGSCAAPNLGAGRDEVGTCRLGEFENTKASVKQQLDDLQAQFPEEDWGYFLNQDGSVRWSDVAISGISHGATTAAIAGRLGERMWRVVSRAGPRDNECGNGECTLPLSTPSYDVNCPVEDYASWLDQPSKTPMNRFYAIVGTTDGQCGDISFNMFHTQYIGEPVLFNMPGTDITGTNRFYSTEGGHYDFLRAPDGVPRTEEVLNIAFAIPPENQNPSF